MVMLFDPFAPMTTERKRFNAELKKKLSEKQDGRCMYCGRRPSLDFMEIDHKNPIKPRSPNGKSGSNNPRNLQLLCGKCNKRKGNKTDKEFRRMYKAAGVPQTQVLPAKVISQDALDKAGKAVATERKSDRHKRKKTTHSDYFSSGIQFSPLSFTLPEAHTAAFLPLA